MKPRLVDLLRCPSDGGCLSVEIFEEARGEIIEGSLRCGSCDSSGRSRQVSHAMLDVVLKLGIG